MACKITLVPQIMLLRSELGLVEFCHSPIRSGKCLQGKLPPPDGLRGIEGTAIGYCQALFKKTFRSSKEHTENFSAILRSMNAPWFNSHELFYGYRGELGPEQFIEEASAPLEKNGRVPIVITSLDPAKDPREIDELFSARKIGETMMVRLVLRSADSVCAAAKLFKNIIDHSRQMNIIPSYWPLFQGELSVEEWMAFRQQLGNYWRYAAIAINPFVISKEIMKIVGDQIAVAQLPLGSSRGVHTDGTIELPMEMKIAGTSQKNLRYNIFSFVKTLSESHINLPVLIILGPSQPNWTENEDVLRLERFLPLLHQACHQLWSHLPQKKVEDLLMLAA